MIKEVKRKFVIDRSKWRSGGPIEACRYPVGLGLTALLNEQGYMCCLGQVCEQLGVPVKQLLSRGGPSSLADTVIKRHPDLRGFLVDDNGMDTDFATTAMLANDDLEQPAEVRESLLIDLFAEQGYTLEFTGEYGT